MMMVTWAEWAEAQAMNAKFVADHIAALYRRIRILEHVIAEDLAPEDCSHDLNRMVVEHVLGRGDLPEMH